jgi:hypothetical protein
MQACYSCDPIFTGQAWHVKWKRRKPIAPENVSLGRILLIEETMPGVSFGPWQMLALNDEGTHSVVQLKYHFLGGEKLFQKQTQFADLRRDIRAPDWRP